MALHTKIWDPAERHGCWFLARIRCVLVHLGSVCALKAVYHFIQRGAMPREIASDRLESHGLMLVSAYDRWDRDSWHACRVKDSLRHANKSRLFPLEMRYLWFGEDNYWVSQWHVFQGRTVHFNVLWHSVSTQLSATVPSACSRKHLAQCSNTAIRLTVWLFLWLHRSVSVFGQRKGHKSLIVLGDPLSFNGLLSHIFFFQPQGKSTLAFNTTPTVPGERDSIQMVRHLYSGA